MKYVCLGYMEEKKWEAMSESERNAFLDACFAYDDMLRGNGHFIGGEALQSPRNATTLRFQNGKVLVTDGPFAETKEQLGGILLLEAKDLNHAIQLMSKHPGVRAGSFEIRPAAAPVIEIETADTQFAAMYLGFSSEFSASQSSRQDVIADQKERVHKGDNGALLASARRRGDGTCF